MYVCVYIYIYIYIYIIIWRTARRGKAAEALTAHSHIITSYNHLVNILCNIYIYIYIYIAEKQSRHSRTIRCTARHPAVPYRRLCVLVSCVCDLLPCLFVFVLVCVSLCVRQYLRMSMSVRFFPWLSVSVRIYLCVRACAHVLHDITFIHIH